MKKSVVVMLTLIFILGIAGTAFAANPFSDVPAGHWAYSAVNRLAAAGIIDGMGDGTFQGGKTMTRYEMARFVARAMTKEDKATVEQKALIEKLAAEFSSELQGLGVRVQKLEEQANKIIIDGNVRLRYDNKQNERINGKTINLDVNTSYAVGDGWAVKSESEWKRYIDYPHTYTDDETMTSNLCEQLYVTSGKHFLVGKYSYNAGYGMSFYSKIQGVQYAIGDDKLMATLNWGHTSDTAAIAGTTNDAADLKTVDLVYNVSNATNIRADYERVENKATNGYSKYYGIGFDTKAGDFAAMAAVSKADLDSDTNYSEKAWRAKLQYKAADLNVKDSSDVFVGYSKIPTKNLLDRDDAEGVDNDYKGTKFGVHFVPKKNTLVTVWYMTGKTISTDADFKYLRAQAEFFF